MVATAAAEGAEGTSTSHSPHVSCRGTQPDTASMAAGRPRSLVTPGTSAEIKPGSWLLSRKESEDESE